jgi:hypothetical protein
VQTFLPYERFEKSAEVMDDKRLNNQINETTVILRTLLKDYRPGGGWPNHPVTKMWEGHIGMLCIYQAAFCREYHRRQEQLHTGWYTLWGMSKVLRLQIKEQPGAYPRPPWLGDERVHASHRSNLLRKDPEHYGQFGWAEDNNIPYFYPPQHEEYQ